MSAVRDDLSFNETTSMRPADMDDADIDVNGPRGPSLFEGSSLQLGELFRGAETLASIRTLPEQSQPTRPILSVALSKPNLPTDGSAANWTKTLTLVERAAATIKAYERRFLQLERQSKAVADRAAEDQHRLLTHIQALEERLKQAEESAAAADTAIRDAEYHEWESDVRAKRAEERAAEAETRSAQAEAYLRRVHELLSTVS